MSDWTITHVVETPDDGTLISEKKVARHYDVTTRTLVNWDRNPKMKELGWPPLVMVNRRRHREVGLLRRFDAALKAAGTSPTLVEQEAPNAEAS
jgi:hypothetical protein